MRFTQQNFHSDARSGGARFGGFGLHLQAFGGDFNLAFICFGNIPGIKAGFGDLRFLTQRFGRVAENVNAGARQQRVDISLADGLVEDAMRIFQPGLRGLESSLS